MQIKPISRYLLTAKPELRTGAQFSFSLKLKSLLRKCRTPKFWVMDFNSQHFRLEIANFYKKSLFID